MVYSEMRRRFFRKRAEGLLNLDMKKIIGFTVVLITVLISEMIFCGANAGAYMTSAESVCVIEANSAEVVYAKNAYTRMPMASTTKIMTAIVALENGSPDDIVTVSEHAASVEGSSAYLEAGYQMCLEDLLYGLMLNSGNDAAVAIAEYIAGSEAAFADMMNHKAWEIGTEETQFTNPNGLPDDNHYTTAYDLALIARYAMDNAEFRKIASAPSHKVQTGDTVLEYYNHNKLLTTLDGCVGIKTGYTNAAGRCLVTEVDRDGMEFITVTLNDAADWEDHRAIYDEVFREYGIETVAHEGERVKFMGADLIYGGDLNITVKKGESVRVRIKTEVGKLEPPIEAGEKVGVAYAIRKGKILGSADVCMKDAMLEEQSFFEDAATRFKRMLNIFLV